MNTIMAKLLSTLTSLLLLSIFITQVYSTEIREPNNSTDLETEDEERLLFGNILRSKCTARLNNPSSAASLTVTLTRLANNRLYYFSPAAVATNLAFLPAQTFCADHGMHLVTINSQTENQLVYAKVAELGLNVVDVGAWIGFRDVTGGNVYRWVQPNVGATPTFFVGGVSTANKCAYYDVTNPALWATANGDCTLKHSFVCEMEPPCSLVL